MLRVVDVVDEADRDAARDGLRERALDDLREVVGKVEVVDRDLERLVRAAEELGELVRGALRRLRAVGERRESDQLDAFAARSFALCSRFAAWYACSDSGESTSPSVGCGGTSGCATATP